MTMNSYADVLRQDDALHAPALRLDYREGNHRRLGKAERLSSGAIRVRANMTRAGVLDYEGGLREYRPPDEVFAPESLASLKSAPVVLGHPPGGEVTLDNWKALAVGHVENVGREGEFVTGTLIISDPHAIELLERGDLSELSPGYVSKLEMRKGTSPEGESFNRIQRGILYNHLALLPAGMGRSGSNVRVRLDSMSLRERAIAAGWTEEDFVALSEVADFVQGAVPRADSSGSGFEQLTDEEVQALLALGETPLVRTKILELFKEERFQQARRREGLLTDEDEDEDAEPIITTKSGDPNMQLTSEQLTTLKGLAAIAPQLQVALAAPQPKTDSLDEPEDDNDFLTRLTRRTSEAWKSRA